MDRIILNHFSPAEIQYLKDLPSTEEYQEHFFAIWTAKEAYFKGVGDGIKETFNQVSFIPESADLRSYQLILPGSPTDQSEWTINTIEIAQGYIAALAYEGQMNKMRQYEFGPENFFRP